jgi:hypothetical protein
MEERPDHPPPANPYPARLTSCALPRKVTGARPAGSPVYTSQDVSETKVVIVSAFAIFGVAARIRVKATVMKRVPIFHINHLPKD